jgi:hypothetical protein
MNGSVDGEWISVRGKELRREKDSRLLTAVPKSHGKDERDLCPYLMDLVATIESIVEQEVGQ